MTSSSIKKISVIVPQNPFVTSMELGQVRHCLAALDVGELMRWWPGQPHTPHREPSKVRAIQRSLDWKRVARIAAYLLQREIVDTPNLLDRYFREIYEPKKLEPGREWPPKVPQVTGFERSEFPTFPNVLLHVNGAKVEPVSKLSQAVKLVFDQDDKDLRFSVIDGQHRINGAFFAVRLLSDSRGAQTSWEIPAEIFLDLDKLGAPPRHQAQIFIDVNFNQKKVDRSLVADLFPTARGPRDALDDKERAQDIGRRLMLETGPLVGMIQIPGIKYGVKDVVTLATLNSAIEDILESARRGGLTSLEEQTDFLALWLDAWLTASGRKHDLDLSEKLDPDNVAYQGRVLVSALTLLPAGILALRERSVPPVSASALEILSDWFGDVLRRARLLRAGQFISKKEFREMGFLGSGGIGRFRDVLWAAVLAKRALSTGTQPEKIAEIASNSRAEVLSRL